MNGNRKPSIIRLGFDSGAPRALPPQSVREAARGAERGGKTDDFDKVIEVTEAPVPFRSKFIELQTDAPHKVGL